MTKLVFLGSKGDIEDSTTKHRYNSSLLLVGGETKLLVDYGALRKYELDEINPTALLITHAHPDHYIWLKEQIKTNIPVYLTSETLNYGQYKPENYKTIRPDEKFTVEPFEILPYRVLHSIRCPAVGFKIRTAESKTLIYNPDLVDIVGKEEKLKNVDVYIGDGSSIKKSLVRRRGDKIFGHTRVTTQINWCKKHNIDKIIFTHLGEETIAGEEEFKKSHPQIILAHDEMELTI